MSVTLKRANILWCIGLVAALINIISIIIFFVLGMTVLHSLILLALIMPMAYFIMMAWKHYKPTYVICVAWSIAWLPSCILSLLAQYTELERNWMFDFVAFYLDMIVNV